MRRGVSLILWPLLGLLSTAPAVWAGLRWYELRNSDNEATRVVAATLGQIVHREQGYFAGSHSYTASLQDLGLDEGLPPAPWRYRVVPTMLRGSPRLLVEADNGETRICMDRRGRLFRSPIRPLPAVREWLPIRPEVKHETTQ